MKLPLLNILRTSKVFAVVLGLHLFVLSLLLFHPGCQRSDENLAATEPSAPMGNVSSLENATFAEPTRPMEGTPGLADNGYVNEYSAETSLTPAAALPAPLEQTYTVVRGDSLWAIARANNVSVDDLLEANGLSRKSVLKVGQTLRIPAATLSPSSTPRKGIQPVAPGSSYSVKPGDTLSKIARAHGVSVRELKNANLLHSDTIRVGQKLTIPDGKATPEPSAPVPTSAPVSSEAPSFDGDSNVHVVAAGESPAVIAKRYGMKTSELMTLNNITDPRHLKVGQKLKVTGADTTANVIVADAPSGSEPMSVEALEAATANTTEAEAPIIEVQPAQTLE